MLLQLAKRKSLVSGGKGRYIRLGIATGYTAYMNLEIRLNIYITLVVSLTKSVPWIFPLVDLTCYTLSAKMVYSMISMA